MSATRRAAPGWPPSAPGLPDLHWPGSAAVARVGVGPSVPDTTTVWPPRSSAGYALLGVVTLAYAVTRRRDERALPLGQYVPPTTA